MEKDKPFWAICLILICGFTKIYGFVELALLIFYPRFWRNMGYVVILSIFFLLLPLVKIPALGLMDYYQQWIQFAAAHSVGRPWETFFYIKLLFPHLPTSIYYYQLTALFILALFTLLNYRSFKEFNFRIEVLGLMMGWIIFFSNMAETHTYVVALLGLMLWYQTIPFNPIARGLMLLNLIILVIVPVDLLCPRAILQLVDRWNINLWLFFVTFIFMVYHILIRRLLCKAVLVDKVD